MNPSRTWGAVLAVVLCRPCFCLTGAPLFEPGKEYQVVTNDEAIGKKRFNLYVPRDYTDDRDWPVIFRYKGRGDKYNPIICRGGRSATCDRGAIIVGMAYVAPQKNRMRPGQFALYLRRELQSLDAVKQRISKHLRVDDTRLFISGSSAGGWLASHLLEYRAQPWAGAMIFVAGRHDSASVLTNEPSVRALRDMPVFFGASLPGASHGANYRWAVRGATLYQQRGAIVTFQTYRKTGWLVCSPLLRDWVRAFVIDGKGDTPDEKRARANRLTRKTPGQIDSTAIIKGQIAQVQGKSPSQLTAADLLAVKELSLTGRYVSDISYLGRLRDLESLDLSFTYVEDLTPLLGCRQLRQLDISDTRVKSLSLLKSLPTLETLTMWNLWIDRIHVDELKQHLAGLKVVDYQWDLYEKDDIGRVVPKRVVQME